MTQTENTTKDKYTRWLISALIPVTKEGQIAFMEWFLYLFGVLANLPFVPPHCSDKLSSDELLLVDIADLRTAFVFSGKKNDIQNRKEVLAELEYAADKWSFPANMLELFVVLATGIHARNYVHDKDRIPALFLRLLKNVDLAEPVDYPIILDRLKVVVTREYESNGAGGFFPLKNPTEDQRTVPVYVQRDLWIQENKQELLEIDEL